MIIISPTHSTEICKHGCEAYPYECCGALLGHLQSDGSKILESLTRLENNWKDSPAETRHRRFAITAKDYRLLEQKADSQKLTLLGFYHTHPDHPPIPSATDLSYAWPFFSYIILSVDKGKAGEMRSFELSQQRAELIEEQLKVGAPP